MGSKVFLIEYFQIVTVKLIFSQFSCQYNFQKLWNEDVKTISSTGLAVAAVKLSTFLTKTFKKIYISLVVLSLLFFCCSYS